MMGRLFSLWAALLLFSPWAVGEEYIKHFHSEIQVAADGDILVTETITAEVEHNIIRRGIYRDFPTTYKTALFTKSTVDFEVLSVQRNGYPEDYHTEQLGNGVRVYIGNRNRMVERGEQVFTLSYRTNRQIAFLKDHDRFSWNVTGNDWQLRIAQVTAVVHLPDAVTMSMVAHEAWTGFVGEDNAHYQSEVMGNTIQITSTQPLAAYQGLTFALEIPKGHLLDNSHWLLDFLSDNLMWVLMVVALLSLLMFYFLAWNQHGRDPEPGVIYPLFYPPDELSPAAMRYILESEANHKNFTAALINLAVKGYITLKKTTKGYQINKVTNPKSDIEPMSSGERIVMRKLFAGSRQRIEISKKYDARIKNTIKDVSKKIKAEYQSKCFKDNAMLGYFGIGISVVVLVFFMAHMNYFNVQTMGAVFIPLGFTLFALFIVFRSNRGLWNSLVVIGHTLFMVGAFVASSGGLSIDVLIMSGFLVLINGVFIYLLKAPTPFGRELMDKIEGFKLYLSTAEQNRLEIMHPPEMTPELFERYLPYAIALGVENSWSERFANYLKTTGTDPSNYQYHPDWYRGGHFNLSGSSSSIGDIGRGMSSTISAAAIPPSSSGGGGGFSGGGGGGGGGGGW